MAGRAARDGRISEPSGVSDLGLDPWAGAIGSLVNEEWQARDNTLRAESEAKATASRAAREKQDEDFRALAISISFEIEGTGCEGENPTDYHDPAMWEFSDDEAGNAALIAMVVPQIIDAMEPWVSHYRALGLLRADTLHGRIVNGRSDRGTSPAFYLVYRIDDGSLDPEDLAAFPPARLKLDALPGATIDIRAFTGPINATLLYETAMLARGDANCAWGGEATDDRFPMAGESRADWLSRVAMPPTTIRRALARWDRSGGNLVLYGLCGSAAERAAGDHPIEWVIPGLILRGYVTLLVGTKMAGKSTLLGEMMAVVDSECQSSRSVLGIEVEARGVGCIVSGEDGDNIINRRADFYTQVHGQSRGFVIDTATYPWPEALGLLQLAPKIDFLGIDPLRAMLPGDEDASGNISPFFDDLNALARKHDCAIVLVHHLSKGKPRSLSALLDKVRGSSAITDRPRMVIGMIDRGAGVTEVGIIKHNIPPSEALWSPVCVGRLFRRDAATLTLVPIETTAQRTTDALGDQPSLALILDGVAYHNERNIVLRRTGKSELFEAKMPQLAAMSRNVLREGVATLLAAGRLVDGPEGLRIAPAMISGAGVA